MKIFVLIFLLPIFSFGANCKLETPIKLNHEIYAQDFKLQNVLLSEVPKFPATENYNPLTDILDIDIHSLSAMGRDRSRYIGVTLIARRTGTWLGFAYQYAEPEKYEGSLQQVDSILAIHSLEISDSPDKITETFLTVEDDFLTSVMLTYPVYKMVNNKMVFTGTNQTVCVVSVEKVLGF